MKLWCNKANANILLQNSIGVSFMQKQWNDVDANNRFFLKNVDVICLFIKLQCPFMKLGFFS